MTMTPDVDDAIPEQLLAALERRRKAQTPEAISASTAELEQLLGDLDVSAQRRLMITALLRTNGAIVVDIPTGSARLERHEDVTPTTAPVVKSAGLSVDVLLDRLAEWFGTGTVIAGVDHMTERIDKAAADLAAALSSFPDDPAAVVVSRALAGAAWEGLTPEAPSLAELTQNAVIAGLVLSSDASAALNRDVAQMAKSGSTTAAMTAREFLQRFGKTLHLPKPVGGALTTRKRALPEPLPPLLRFPADRVHKGTVEGLSRIAEWASDAQGFFRGLEVTSGRNFRQVMGFRHDPGQVLWDFLRSRGESAIKAHYALWARCYEETGADPDKYVHISVPQFCADLGYKRHQKGGYRREHKLEAMKLLEALTTAELSVIWQVGTKERRLKGAIWDRGLEGEERDVYSDLFGSARAGDQAMWDPVAFTYKPGPWFADKEWRRQNRYLGVVGLGLLRLDNRLDRWALRIGGYYGSLARMGQFTPRTIAVATVLARTGLDRLDTGHPGAREERFSRAHQRLCDVGVLKSWAYTGEEVGVEPDMDDPDALAVLAEYGAGDWRKKRVTLTWPDDVSDRAEGLLANRPLALAAAPAP